MSVVLYLLPDVLSETTTVASACVLFSPRTAACVRDIVVPDIFLDGPVCLGMHLWLHQPVVFVRVSISAVFEL